MMIPNQREGRRGVEENRVCLYQAVKMKGELGLRE
jgi:hypothetical protein